MTREKGNRKQDWQEFGRQIHLQCISTGNYRKPSSLQYFVCVFGMVFLAILFGFFWFKSL
jgi:hypothetical protein